MAGVALTFRFAEPGDVPAIVSLVESAYRGEASRQGWTTEADLLDGHRTDAAAVSTMLSTEGSAILVAEADGLLAGCCKLERHPRATVSFGLFAVPPDRQGQGRGRAILAEAERLANLAAMSITQTVTQLRAPRAKKGQVIGVYGTSANGMRIGSGFTVGLFGAAIGLRSALAVSSVALCVCGLALAIYLAAAARRSLTARPAPPSEA
jgi:N-acetylglutamate synthase-like GNAT family acetyltransferase